MRIGLCLACSAMLLQLAVLMQPILPEQIRIALVCQSISELLSHAAPAPTTLSRASSSRSSASSIGSSTQRTVLEMDHAAADLSHIDLLSVDFADQQQAHHAPHQHAAAGDCLYCMVYAHLFSGLDLSIQQVLDAVYVRLMAFKQGFQAVYFALQRLYLFPQGRAPPF